MPDIFYLLFSVEVPPDDVIGLNERVQFLLQIFVLLSKQGGVLLKSLKLGLQIQVSIHEGLVGVVDCFQVSVLSPFVDFDAIEFSFKPLESCGQLMGSIVLGTVLPQLVLLFFN